jgi:glycosyltransferase involved in cell wall biosynthesis
MKIGFDAKRLYANPTGLGSYSRTLINRLIEFYPDEEYRLFVHQKFFNKTAFKYPYYTKNTVVSAHFNDKLWRQKKIETDIAANNIQIFHGLSNEIPVLKNKNIKKIVTIHDIIFKKLPETFSVFDRNIYRYKTQKALEQADAVVVVSKQTQQDIVEYFKADESKIHLIYPTWNKEYDHDCNYILKERFIEKRKLPRDFVLYVGSISKRKNFLILLKALALPENHDKNLVAVSQGGDEYATAQSFVYEHKLEDRVYFLKNILWYELPIIYHLAQGLVYPSLYEGFGLPVLEALVCGKPVITCNISSMPEVGDNACIFVNPENVEEISSAINFIYYNLDLAEEIKTKAAIQIQKFHPEKITRQMHELYQSVVSG